MDWSKLWNEHRTLIIILIVILILFLIWLFLYLKNRSKISDLESRIVNVEVNKAVVPTVVAPPPVWPGLSADEQGKLVTAINQKIAEYEACNCASNVATPAPTPAPTPALPSPYVPPAPSAVPTSGIPSNFIDNPYALY